jgi:hypothetical protein
MVVECTGVRQGHVGLVVHEHGRRKRERGREIEERRERERGKE